MAKDMRNGIEIYSSILYCEKLYNERRAFLKIKTNDIFEIALVISGSGIHRVLDKDIPSSKGDIFVIPPNTPHGYFLEKENDEFVIRQLFLSLDNCLYEDFSDPSRYSYCYGIFRENSTLGYAVLNANTFENLNGLLDMIEDEIKAKKDEYENAVKSILSYLLIIISRYINSSIKNLSFASFEEWNIVSNAIRIIREEYSYPNLTTEEVAGRFYISKSRFGRLFSKLTGNFFSDYLRDVRLKNVCTLLEQSKSNIEDVAKECGFNNIPTFYKNFYSKINMTPKEYRLSVSHTEPCLDEYIRLLKGKKIMQLLNDISANLQKGKAKIVKELVQQAIDEGIKPADILERGLLDGMSIIGEKFKNNEIFVPEVLVAARAMNMGAQILKPHLAEAGIKATGRVCLGTVQGDLHDIGKNLVKMMMEGKGLEVIDLGTDVAPETFVKTAIEQNCDIICCSALLTTTMPIMEDVVKACIAAEIRNKVKIMIGGAPVSNEYCKLIGADCYTVDAASAADAAIAFCKEQKTM